MLKGIRQTRKRDSKHWAKYTFEILRSPKGKKKYSWRIIACNGNSVCRSEKYTMELNAAKTFKNLIKAIQAGQFKVTEELIHE